MAIVAGGGGAVDPNGLGWRRFAGGVLGGIAGFVIAGPAGAVAGVGFGAGLGDAADQAAETGEINWARAAGAGATDAALAYGGGKLFGWLGKKAGPLFGRLFGKPNLATMTGDDAASQACAMAETQGLYPAQGQRPVDGDEVLAWANKIREQDSHGNP